MQGNWIQQDVIDNLINFHSCSHLRTLHESVLEIGASRSRRIARIAAVAEELLSGVVDVFIRTALESSPC